MSKFFTKILDEMIKLLSLSAEFRYLYNMPFHIVLFLMLIPAISFVCVPIPYICLSQGTLSLLHVRPNGTNGDSLQVLRFIRISSEALHTFFFLLAKKHVEFPQMFALFFSYLRTGLVDNTHKTSYCSNGDRSLGSHY
jgi:hypothetical protein